MDIDLLSRMVKEVILDRDRVVLPGLGTFVAEMVPASFSDKGYTVNPPYRRLYFRHRMEEDSSLAEIYSASNNISTELAGEILADFLQELRQVLMEKKVVVLPGLGRLRATKENNFFFVPDENLDIYPEGFGLEPISLKTHNETREELSAAMDNLKSIIRPEPAAVQDDVAEAPAVTETEAPEPAAVQDDAAEAPAVTETEAPEPAAVQDDAAEAPAVTETEVPEPAETEQSATGQESDASSESPVQEPLPSGPAPEAGRRRTGRAVMITVIVVMVIISLLLIYMILNLLFPGLFDSLLYNDDQLQVIEFFSK